VPSSETTSPTMEGRRCGNPKPIWKPDFPVGSRCRITLSPDRKTTGRTSVRENEAGATGSPGSSPTLLSSRTSFRNPMPCTESPNSCVRFRPQMTDPWQHPARLRCRCRKLAGALSTPRPLDGERGVGTPFDQTRGIRVSPFAGSENPQLNSSITPLPHGIVLFLLS